MTPRASRKAPFLRPSPPNAVRSHSTIRASPAWSLPAGAPDIRSLPAGAPDILSQGALPPPVAAQRRSVALDYSGSVAHVVGPDGGRVPGVWVMPPEVPSDPAPAQETKP